MTLEERAGRLLWCGWGDAGEPGPRTVNAHARFLVDELHVGGLIVFDRNLGEPEEIAALTAALRERAGRPLFLGIDQEGGRVSRMPRPGMVFPGSMALGELDRVETTRAVCRAIGEQLAAVGIDVDFAPSLDVNNNPRNPVIGVRSFGEEPERVTRHGLAALAGFRDAGVLPVIKHFPGHGDTATDSHLALPVQPAGRERLDAVELVPFRAALAAGAPAVMTTHIVFPQLDPGLPSTLSPAIVTGLLRGELGFEGLVVTDCLEMKGIADHWSPEEAAVLAVLAGVDMLVVCHTQQTQERMHQALCEAVRGGRISEDRLDESVARIDRALELTEGVRNRPLRPERVSAPEYRELEGEVTLAALRVEAGARGGSPFPWDRGQPVVVSGAAGPAASATEALTGAGLRAEAVPWEPGVEERLRSAPQLLWLVLPGEPFPEGTPPADAAALLETHPRAAVAALREPYVLARYPEAVPRVAAWGGLPAHLQALARLLAGSR